MTTLPELVGYLAATMTTAAFVPQAVLTIRTRNTDSLSLAMYGTFTLGVTLWLVYGCFLGDLAIIVANAVTLLLALAILWVKIDNTFGGKKAKRRYRD